MTLRRPAKENDKKKCPLGAQQKDSRNKLQNEIVELIESKQPMSYEGPDIEDLENTQTDLEEDIEKLQTNIEDCYKY